MNYYIADPHFGHSAIIRLCNRPFQSVEEMDETICTNWNRKVTNGDNVFILGDFMYRSRKKPSEYLTRLKGRKYLILGNHDASWIWQEETSRHIETSLSMMELIDHNRKVVLCHYPMLSWPNAHGGAYMVYGHIHGHRDQDPCLRYGLSPNMLNACVEVNGYQPVTLDEMIENNRSFRAESDKPGTGTEGEES